MFVVFVLFAANTKGHYKCETVVVFSLIFGYIAFAGGSLLIVLRIIAIWRKMKSIIAIAAIIWGTNVAFLVQGIVRIRAAYVEAAGTCLVLNTHSAKLNILVTLVTDILLLLIMLIGLLRLRFHEHGAFSMGRFLWRQGLIWLFIATISEVPPAVFICLNLNDPFNYMFWGASLITLSIAATRIHRSLIDFAYENTEVYDRGTLPFTPADSGPGSHGSSEPSNSKTLANGRTDSKVNQSASLFTPPNRMEVTIHMAYEEYQKPPSMHSDSAVSAEEGLGEKPTGLGLGDDVEKIA